MLIVVNRIDLEISNSTQILVSFKITKIKRSKYCKIEYFIPFCNIWWVHEQTDNDENS